MSCLLKRAMHVSRSACQKLKVRPRSVFDSTSAEVIIDKVVVEQRVIRPKARALFPWRESSLPSDSLANRLYNLASIVSVSFATFGTTIFGTLARSRDFIPGGATAFRCATDSIFYHELMQKHRQQVKMLTTGVEFADAKDVAGLSDIFGDELQAFYRHAIEQHCLKSTHHCTYSLLGVQGVYVSNKELLVGIPRARNEQYVKVGLMWPGQHAIVPTKFRNVNPSKLPPEERKAFDLEVKRCINTKESTVRVWLDVECTGKLLKNSETRRRIVSK